MRRRRIKFVFYRTLGYRDSGVYWIISKDRVL
jgi:hypothetical protein